MPRERPYVVDTPERFRAFAHPLRQEIISAISEPRSVTDVADELGVPASRLYHHFKLLEREGVIAACGTRRVRSNDERLYRRVASSVTFAPSITEVPALRGQLRAGVADFAEEFVREFLEAGLAWEKGDIASDVPVTVSRRTVELTIDEARGLADRLSESVGEILGRRRRRTAGRRTWVYASFFFPEVER